MMDPKSAIENIYTIARIIYDQVKLVKANAEQCNRLASRILTIEVAVKGLDGIKDKSQYTKGLNDLLGTLNACLELIQKFSASGRWSKWILRAGNYKDDFDDLNDQLQKAVQQLNLGLAAQQIINREEDKIDQEVDINFIKNNQTLIIELNMKELEQMEAIRLSQQEQKEILQLQMTSIQAQLKMLMVQDKKTAVKTVSISHRIPYYDLVFDNLLDNGSFGKIYVGFWENQQVVIKMLEGALTERDKQQFKVEVDIMGRLRHPNVTSFYGSCLEKTHACLVMEYMEQGSLDKVLRKGPLKLEQQKALALDIATGLGYLHNEGVLHRDLKSANVLVNEKGMAKITDFGLSRIEAIVSLQSAHERSQAFPWQAPECFDGQYKHASDIYSYGVILWEIATGQSPTWEASRHQELSQKGERWAIPATLPTPLVELIRACWQVNPDNRPDVKEVIRQLKAYEIRPASPTAEEYYVKGQDCERTQDPKKAFDHYKRSMEKGYYRAHPG